jgi:peptide deformylase
MSLRRIIEYPDPVLKARAEPLSNITGEVAELARDMVETMYAAPGIGLAAPQVGVSRRLIVLDVRGADGESGRGCCSS